MNKFYGQISKKLFLPLEIQNLSSVDSFFVNSQYEYSQNLSVQQFDTGLVVLPQLPFVGVENDTFYSDSLFFSFLDVPLDTTNAIFDIKSLKKYLLTSQRRNHTSMVLLVSSYFVLLVYYLIRRFKKKEQIHRRTCRTHSLRN